MYLKKLELLGFKSFAHKTNLEFDKNITAVVGPNGSGKSNIADAVRWVLGEQSMKTLRGKKSEDVIFAGSKTRARLGTAQVSLHLDNEDGSIPLDFPEIVISRKIYRSGESEYSINKRQVRLIDIIELLAKSGFGQKTYSVIAQGMADAILSAAPKERREIFEEAAGVKHLQIKKHQAERKLAATKANLQRVQDILKEIAPRLRSLKRQANKAKNREQVEEELKLAQKTWFANLFSEFQEKKKEQEKEKSKLQDKINKLTSEIEKKQKAVEKEEKASFGSQDKFLSLQEILENLQNQQGGILQNLALLEGKIMLAQERKGIDLPSYDPLTLAKEKKEVASKLRKLEEETKKLGQKLKDSLEDLRKKEKIYQEEQKKLNQLQKEQPPVFDFPELQEEIEEVYALQQNVIDRLLQVEDLEELQEIQRDAQIVGIILEGLIAKLEQTGEKESSISWSRVSLKIQSILEEKNKLQEEVNKLKIEGAKKELEKDALEKDLRVLEDNLSKAKKTPPASKKEVMALSKEKNKLIREKEEVAKKIQEIKKQIQDTNKEDVLRKKDLFNLEREFRSLQDELQKLRYEENNLNIALTKNNTHFEDILKDAEEALGKSFREDLENGKVRAEKREMDLSLKINKLKEKLAQIGSIDPQVVEEFEETNQRYAFLDQQSSDLKEASKSLREAIKKLDEKIKEQFQENFNRINEEFNKFFRIFFGGGQAHLSLQKISPQISEAEAAIREAEKEKEAGRKEKTEEEEEEKEETSGIEIKAVPPGKKIKALSALSGGERALTSLSILFAIISANPSPFVVLDEVDAALDEANSRRFAKILSQFAEKTQFVVITHNRQTMQQAKMLYGVTMQDDGISRLLSVKLDEIKK